MQPFSPHPSVQLPVTNTKRDARANQNDIGGSKLSVADSLVLLQSLKQSRATWLTKAFLRFSTRSKNKADQPQAPPPHSLSLAGTCDIEIGPHLFPQTSIYFVQYQYTHPPTPIPVPKAAPAPTLTPTPAPPPAPTSAQAQPGGPITVSHELHAKVLAAAAKDPELHNILQLAAQGRANVTQLRVLGATIKSIEAGTYPNQNAPTTSALNVSAPVLASAAAATTASTSQQPTSTPAPAPAVAPAPAPIITPASTPVPAPTAATTPAFAPSPTPASVVQSTPVPTIPAPTPRLVPTTPTIPTTAILLEFAERPIDRWLLPSEYVLLDKAPNGDILLSTFYPFDAYVPTGGIGPNGATARSKPANPLTIRFLAASTGVWTALSRTCTTVSRSGAQSVLTEVITHVPTRTYLQYRISPGSLWEDLKAKNPSAKSVLLPSTIPKPSTSAQSRRAEDSAGGATKKRRTNAGNSGTSTPAAKGKGKEKEKGATPTGATQPGSTQPAATTSVPAPTIATPNVPVPFNSAPSASSTVPSTSATPLPNATPSMTVANPPNAQPSATTVTPGPQIPVLQPPTQGGTLNKALPPINPAPRPLVQHVSAGRPGEGVKVLSGEGTPPTSGTLQ